MEGKEGLEGLENRKGGLIEQAKRLDRVAYGRDCEIKALQTVLNSKKRPPTPGRVKAEVEGLEFRIATEAYTVHLERELLKRIKEKKDQLREAIDFARKRGRLRRLEEELAGMRRKRAELEEEIQQVKKEITGMRRKEEREQFREGRRKRREEVLVRKKKEMEKHQKALEGLELGDIVVIRRREEEREED